MCICTKVAFSTGMQMQKRRCINLRKSPVLLLLVLLATFGAVARAQERVGPQGGDRGFERESLLDPVDEESSAEEENPTVEEIRSVLPIIDLGHLYGPSFPYFYLQETIDEIGAACRDYGFFYITNIGGRSGEVHSLKGLYDEATWFFKQAPSFKRKIDMSLGGSAWRGYFAVGDELTSGIPDEKEGIYFSRDSNETGPLKGKNLYPVIDDDPDKHVLFKETVPAYMDAMRQASSLLLQAIALSLDLDARQLNFTEPTELFRVFSYPPHSESFGTGAQGVGEHTDYGYLTILFQDEQGGLQVRDVHTNEWLDVAPIPGTFVVNLGDALEHFTGGLYRATPHRVVQRSQATTARLSFPYFFDPSMSYEMKSVFDQLSDDRKQQVQRRREVESADPSRRRWDNKDVTQFKGTYGEYLLGKVSKVFPSLFATTISPKSPSDEL